MDRMKMAYMLLGRFIRDRAIGRAETNNFWVERTWEIAASQAALWSDGIRDDRIFPMTHEMMKGIE